MAVGDGFEGAAQIGVCVDVIDFAGFDQRGHAGPGVAALVVPGEERVLAIEGYWADGVFDGVGVHLVTAVGQQDLQPVPVAVDIAELLAEAGFGGEAAALLDQPEAEVGDKGGGLLLADGKAFFGRAATDAGFDLGDLCDAAQALGGDPRRCRNSPPFPVFATR